MLTLADLARDLSLGHLSDLPAFGAGDGTLEPTRVPQFLARTNDALRAVYTRLPLSMKSVVLEAIDGVHQYPLRPEFALTSASAEPNKYLKDTIADPFLGDVLAIERVFNADLLQLPLNDRYDPLSVHTPAYDTVAISAPVTGERYHIEFRAAHAPVPTAADTVLADIKLYIPPALYSAFKLHIAAGLHEGAGSEGTLLKAKAYGTAYEAEVGRLEHANTLQQSMVDTNQAPERGGWI